MRSVAEYVTHHPLQTLSPWMLPQYMHDHEAVRDMIESLTREQEIQPVGRLRAIEVDGVSYRFAQPIVLVSGTCNDMGQDLKALCATRLPGSVVMKLLQGLQREGFGTVAPYCFDRWSIPVDGTMRYGYCMTYGGVPLKAPIPCKSGIVVAVGLMVSYLAQLGLVLDQLGPESFMIDHGCHVMKFLILSNHPVVAAVKVPGLLLFNNMDPIRRFSDGDKNVSDQFSDIVDPTTWVRYAPAKSFALLSKTMGCRMQEWHGHSEMVLGLLDLGKKWGVVTIENADPTHTGLITIALDRTEFVRSSRFLSWVMQNPGELY